MTQVQTMTNPELNRALMVALGCQVEEHSGTVFFFSILPNGNRLYHQLPDYAGDPAASLEVQTAAIAKDDEGYVRTLYTVQARAKTGMNINPNDIKHWPHMSISIIAILLSASPRERAEAAYITLQGAVNT